MTSVHKAELLMQMVQDNLWSKYPPEPADPEDLRFEQLEQEEALQGKARAKVGGSVYGSMFCLCDTS